jgi:hypothetical protein
MQRIGDNVNKTSFNYAFTRLMDARHRELQMVLSIGNYYKAINKTKLHVAALAISGHSRRSFSFNPKIMIPISAIIRSNFALLSCGRSGGHQQYTKKRSQISPASRHTRGKNKPEMGRAAGEREVFFSRLNKQSTRQKRVKQ